jgi:hypothetical protein
VLEWLHGGISPDVLSIAEALNLTVLVLLVAKGRATGARGWSGQLLTTYVVQARPAPTDVPLATWLQDHHLRYGLSEPRSSSRPS